MAIRDHYRLDVLARKAAELQAGRRASSTRCSGCSPAPRRASTASAAPAARCTAAAPRSAGTAARRCSKRRGPAVLRVARRSSIHAPSARAPRADSALVQRRARAASASAAGGSWRRLASLPTRRCVASPLSRQLRSPALGAARRARATRASRAPRPQRVRLPDLPGRQRAQPGNLARSRRTRARPHTSRASALSGHLHPDFGTNPAYGIPYTVVGADSRRCRSSSPNTATNPSPGPTRSRRTRRSRARREEGDRHVLVLQDGTLQAVRAVLGRARRRRAGRPARARCSTCAATRCAPKAGPRPTPPGCRSSRCSRATRGARGRDRPRAARDRRRARSAATSTRRRTCASSSSDPALPPMGLRLRLKASYSLAGFHGQALVILRALKRYGLIVADNGSPWYITGAPGPALERRRPRTAQAACPARPSKRSQTGPILHAG